MIGGGSFVGGLSGIVSAITVPPILQARHRRRLGCGWQIVQTTSGPHVCPQAQVIAVSPGASAYSKSGIT